MAFVRRVLIRASRSAWLARELRDRAFVRRAVRRFMPGESLAAALDAAAAFARSGIGSVLTQLGEQVGNRADAALVRDHYLTVLGQVRQHHLPVELSVKLTHLGLDVDRETCFRDLAAVARRAAETGSFVWIDMEESRYVDVTLELFRRVRALQANVGVCLQTYLRRSAADLEALLVLAPAIRLVKGAYNEPVSVAFPRKRDVDERYVTLAERLLEAAVRGRARPVFGTHDLGLITRIRGRARALGADPGAYEVHMLYGIRAAEQRALVREGCRVRVLISYGSAWFAWYLRRLAERPANVWFVMRHLVS